MLVRPYETFSYRSQYAKHVGELCSVLYHSNVSISDIERILSSSKLFEEIEEHGNELLFTSDLHCWIPVLEMDNNMNDIFTDSPLSLSVEIDWLSWWSGNIIAALALHKNIRMRDVLAKMSFSDFMEKSVAWHAQPNEYIFEYYDNLS